MRKIPAAILVLALLAVLISGSALAADYPGKDEVDRAVDGYFRKARTIGGSLVIMKDGQVVYERDYGLRSVNSRLPVDENTYFKMGSVTKMICAMAVLQLVDEGKLDLDADISQYFGYRIVNPYYPKTPLTLRQLLSHTSTVSESGGYSRLTNTVERMLGDPRRSAANFQQAEPGSHYRYSNFGAGLAGSIVEAVSGQSLARFMQERVFEPLGMDASLAANWLQSPEDISNLHKDGKLFKAGARYVREGYEDTASPETHYRTLVGGLFIRSRDLARLTHALATDGSLDGHRLLSPQAVMLMREQQHLLGKSVTAPSPYGLFMERNTRLLPGKIVYGHQGMTGGANNNAYFEPESGFVFALTTNGGSQVRDHGTVVLAQNLLRYTYPLFSGENN